MFKKLTALFLALLMVAGMVACGNTNEPTEPEATEPQQTEPQMELTIDPVTYFILNLQEDGKTFRQLTASPNEDGSVYVELIGDLTKKGTIEGDAITTITYNLEKSGLLDLNGQSEYGEGEAYASAYITYGEEGYLSADYAGTIPQAYIDGFQVLEDCFKELTAGLEEYVPVPQEVGLIAEGDKLAMNEILDKMNIANIDSFTMTNVEMEDAETFGYYTGLSSSAGIESGVQLAPMMMTTPYSLVIVTLTDAATASVVAADFEANIDWMKWVCVNPSNAAIAVKDNQVLCLIGGDDLYAQTITAIGEAGWEPVANLENPNM